MLKKIAIIQAYINIRKGVFVDINPPAGFSDNMKLEALYKVASSYIDSATIIKVV